MCNYKMSHLKQLLSLTTSFSVGFSTLDCLHVSCLGMYLSPFQLPFLGIGCGVLEAEVTDAKYSPFQCKAEKLLFYCDYSILFFLLHFFCFILVFSFILFF